ncbi:MAG: ornithine cyclodeaminase [Gemmatimonadota bacterium]
MQLTVLSGAEVERCLDMATAIELVAGAFAALSEGRADVPLRARIAGPRGATLFMPVRLPGPGGDAVATKVVSVFPENPDRGRPSVHAAILLLDPDTGAPAALMEGTGLTALRTGAASGVATRLLAREDARVLAVFGAGAQARTQIEAVRCVRSIEEVRVVSRSGRSARRLAAELVGVSARPVSDSRDALAGADVVVAATDSSSPVFAGRSVEPGTHVNGVGSFTPLMREVDGELVARATVVVDSRESARAEAGDLVGAVEEGWIGWDHVHAELGEIVSGARPGRTTPDEVTFFKSVGSAVQDAATARRVLDEARRLGLGTTVEL